MCPPMDLECASSMMSCLLCSKTHQWRMSSNPKFYRDSLIRVKGKVVMAKIFFFFLEYPRGVVPSCRN